jgi:energy-coupling factor transporter ATP-binding protein EcfA2/energy-coupling factor transporter transmembrane protein EcfT
MRIELTNVDYWYDKEPAVQNINAIIPSRSFTLLLGKTGSGKSTLLQLISGLEQPSSGTLHYSEDDHRRKTAIVFQLPETQLFASTVQQDIEYGLELQGVPKGERIRKARVALVKVGLDPDLFLERSPFLLSGGEMRRIVIAGALSLEPKLLILDEPTAGLDPSSTRDLLDVLVQLHSEGLTILISTHDLDTFLPIADQVIIMKEGGVHFEGGVRELVSHPDMLEEAGLVMPATIRFAYRLRDKGVEIDNPLNMQEMLSAIRTNKLTFLPRGRPNFNSETTNGGQIELDGPVEKAGSSADWRVVGSGSTYVHGLDPRVKWLAMIVLSLAILSLSHLYGVIASAALIVVLVRISDISWRKMYRFLFPFFFTFGLLWLFTAVSMENADVWLGPIGISYSGAAKGGLGVIGFLLVIALGLVFTETTNGSPLREGFEWAIRPLRKLKFPTRDLSMMVSITIQFVPWILNMFGQIRKALASRGQDTIGLKKWTPRQISFLIVPLIIIVLKMGDELVSAIDARGYDRQMERTSWYELRWAHKDTIVGLAMTTIAFLLWRFG